MKAVWRMILGLSVLSLLISCSSSYERKGDTAYSLSKKTQGDERRLQLKTAYIMYQKAIAGNPSKASRKLRERFIEMSLSRAFMVLNEGAAHMDAIPLYMKDIDQTISPEVSPELKQQYASFLVQLADSSIMKNRLEDAMQRIDQAIAVATDAGQFHEKKKQIIQRTAQESFERAEFEYKDGVENKDEEALVRSEYYVLTTLLYAPDFPGAGELLEKLRKANKGTYSAYLKVIDPIPDTTIFRKINKHDILLAAPVVSQGGGSVNMTVHIYNYSWNPLRLKAEDFFVEDAQGNKHAARPAVLEPEILDQEHEAKVKLNFSFSGGSIQKLIYKNGEHYSEKVFM